MSESKKKNGKENGNLSSINPIYKKFARTIDRAFSDTDFFDYFMKMISSAENSFTFSNRRKNTVIDEEWVDRIDDALLPFQNILYNSRNVIKEEEIIVNVSQAKKNTPDTIRHLAQHSALVQDYDEEKNEIHPERLMQKLRDESIEIYENRLVFSALETAYNFTRIRHDAILGAMSDEFGAKLKMNSTMENEREFVNMEMFLHIKRKDDLLETDAKHEDVFARISRIYRILSAFMNTPFARLMAKSSRIKGSIVKTNILKRNPDYKAIVNLYEFLQQYDQIGYAVKIEEQSPEITKEFREDIYRNMMAQYIILKHHLEEEEERAIPGLKAKKRTLKPKFIHQIIEELTEDFDLPDVEVRKIFIDALSKDRFEQETEDVQTQILSETERYRLQEEAERKQLSEEQERAAAIRAERLRQEEAARAAAAEHARIEQSNEDNRLKKLFESELTRFSERLQTKIEERNKYKEKLEAAENRMQEEEVKFLRRKAAFLPEEEEGAELRKRLTRKQLLIYERLEEEQLLREKEKETLREEEALRRKELDERLEREAKEELSPYLEYIRSFNGELDFRKNARTEEERERQREQAERAARFAEKKRRKTTNGGDSV